jgi:alpha-L-fucosidase 2
MLLQSRPGTVDLLPALPEAWPNGSFAGLMARGGIAVDAAWSAGRLTTAALRDTTGSERAVVVRCRGTRVEVRIPAFSRVELNPSQPGAVGGAQSLETRNQ